MAMPPEVKELAAKVRNWGRWGDDDEIGTLNLITDDVVKAAAARDHDRASGSRSGCRSTRRGRRAVRSRVVTTRCAR